MADKALTYYDLLGVRQDASLEEIRDAYAQLFARIKPDAATLGNVDTSKLTGALIEAWSTLKDPEKRRQYDAFLSRKAAPADLYTQSIPALPDERAREYVEQLEKSRSFWDSARQRAEAERVSKEEAAREWVSVRDRAQRIRSAGENALERAERAVESGARRWRTLFIIAFIAVVVAVPALFLVMRLTNTGGSVANPEPVSTAKRPPHAAAARSVAHGQPVAGPAIPGTNATAAGVAHAHAPAVARVQATPIARVHAPSPVTQLAPGCAAAHVAQVADDGSTITTTDGRLYRVDAGAAFARAWSAGDRVTICARTLEDGTVVATLDRGDGSVHAIRSGLASAYGNPPVCGSAVIDRIADDGATLQVSDGRVFLVDDDEAMRLTVRNWSTGSNITVCSKTQSDGAVRVSVVGADTLKVSGTLQRPR